MTPILDEVAPVSWEGLAARIRRSSHLRFNWQWFSLDAVPAASPAGARGILDRVVSDPACHRFLEASFTARYEPAFKIEPVHDHCRAVDVTRELEGILARAATDRLGAYSRELVDAPAPEVMEIRAMLRPVFPYNAFSLEPGNVARCSACKSHNNHLFTSWFYGVAWDWCFCLLPQGRPIAWVGCLTDTD
jgi:hypothetical protein